MQSIRSVKVIFYVQSFNKTKANEPQSKLQFKLSLLCLIEVLQDPTYLKVEMKRRIKIKQNWSDKIALFHHEVTVGLQLSNYLQKLFIEHFSSCSEVMMIFGNISEAGRMKTIKPSKDCFTNALCDSD